jgi:hypothetical protein
VTVCEEPDPGQCDGRHEDGVCATCERESLRTARYEALYDPLGDG